MTRSAHINRIATTSAIAAAAVLHAAWGRGSTFPFASKEELCDKVIGSTRAPSRHACYAVAAALATLSLLSGAPATTTPHRFALRVAAGALLTRGALGLAGRTDLIVQGSNGANFRARDRRIYAPICLAMATGITRSIRARDRRFVERARDSA